MSCSNVTPSAIVEAPDVPGITQWLIRWREGDPGALDRLTGLVYMRLRRLAAAMLRNEPFAQTLQSTALVHELYLNLDRARGIPWKCRGQFFAICAKVMRRILVDHARKRSASKRSAEVVSLHSSFAIAGPDLLEVDAALRLLASEHPRQALVVELRFFGGLTTEETAEALTANGESVSPRTVERDWRFSRAWLQNALERSSHV